MPLKNSREKGFSLLHCLLTKCCSVFVGLIAITHCYKPKAYLWECNGSFKKTTQTYSLAPDFWEKLPTLWKTDPRFRRIMT